MVSGNVISNLRRSCLSGCHRSCRVVVGLSGVGCCRVLQGAVRLLGYRPVFPSTMNALAAFGEWGCEDRLSGPAFAETTALVGWFRERAEAHLAAGLQMSCGAAAGGIHAVAEIPRGAIVASIPLSLLITQATAHVEAELRGVRGGTNLMGIVVCRLVIWITVVVFNQSGAKRRKKLTTLQPKNHIETNRHMCSIAGLHLQPRTLDGKFEPTAPVQH